MLINCDIGERGTNHEVDNELMKFIDIANIACGGHAGDSESVEHYKKLAKENNVKISAHLSYPDKENFGRETMRMPVEMLIDALEEQAVLFGEMECVKFHGALYNDVNRSAELADELSAWLHAKGVKEVLTPYRSMLYKGCIDRGIQTINEAFADRQYVKMNLGLELMSRNHIGAVIENVDDVVRQVKKIKNGAIKIDGMNYLIEADTVCVHSDSPNSLEMVQALCAIK